MATESSFPFLTLLPEKSFGFGGVRPAVLLVLLLDQGPRLGWSHQKYCRRAAFSADRLCSPKTGRLCSVSGETLSRRGPLVRVGQDCGAGLRPEAQVRERPGPLGGQPGVWALVCNLKLEEVVKKEILRQAKNRRDLETRKMSEHEWEESERLPWKSQPSLKSKCYCLPSESKEHAYIVTLLLLLSIKSFATNTDVKIKNKNKKAMTEFSYIKERTGTYTIYVYRTPQITNHLHVHLLLWFSKRLYDIWRNWVLRGWCNCPRCSNC